MLKSEMIRLKFVNFFKIDNLSSLNMNKLSNFTTIIDYFKFLIIALFFFYLIIIIWPQNNLKKESSFQIPTGSSLYKVSKILKKNNIIKNETSFILAVTLMGYEKKTSSWKVQPSKRYK